MSERLSLSGSDLQDRPVVDVFDKPYRLLAVTRSVEQALTTMDRALRELEKDEDADGDAYVTVLCQALDALLKPAEGHRTGAGTLVRKQWEADALSVDDLSAFCNGLQEQAVNSRPT